ncbi:MAG: sulfite exporter TauE/SafE family protein [Candidatus Thiodiazotropha sp. (ex Monitilora ramsayi)]|nr:sulfite exporter TauE/SafE family protein [Candidatus Thiodiazotropha sp. (ex Monitilora ramsayi)]
MIDFHSPLQLTYLSIVIFGAYFVRGIVGFGSALVAVPLLALVMPITIVVPVIVLLDYLASMSHGIRHFKHIQWKDLFPLLPFTLVGILLALYLLKSLQPGMLTNSLGIFIICYAIYSLLPLPPLRGSRSWAIPLGTLTGLIGTLFGTGGPFTVIYLGLRELGKSAFRGTIATFFAIDGGMRLIGFSVSGFYGRENLVFALVALPVMAIGLYAGGHIHTNLSRTAFVRLVAVILIGSGIALLMKRG